jgi:hypothetical protein
VLSYGYPVLKPEIRIPPQPKGRKHDEDGTFHSVTDAVTIQYLTETVSAAQGTGPVGYIRGGAAAVINS